VSGFDREKPGGSKSGLKGGAPPGDSSGLVVNLFLGEWERGEGALQQEGDEKKKSAGRRCPKQSKPKVHRGDRRGKRCGVLSIGLEH